MVGRWDPVKNHEAFLALAKEARVRDLPWRFHVVTAIKPNKPWYQNILGEYTGYIKVHSPMSGKDLKKFYRDMDLMILPSHFEVWGGVVMEALFQNKITLISPNVGWVDYYRKFGLNKAIIDFQYISQAVKKIHEFLGEMPPADFVRYVKKEHAPDNTFKKFLKLVNTIVKVK
jgi:glycosyltransferase involved in cell wall biosynthesis